MDLRLLKKTTLKYRYQMIVNIINEYGYEEAMMGLSLSYNSTVERVKEVAPVLAVKDGGHNKFLESMIVYLDIVAARYWWQQFDTYRVGTSRQSGSTMHTLMNSYLEQSSFESPICEETLTHLNSLIYAKDFNQLKKELPEGFLQRRIVCTNYKTLRNIIFQRTNHRLDEWKNFCSYIRSNVIHPEFLSI